MGKDNRVIDSDAVEAKVDSGNEALQVHTFFDSTADLDTIEATLTNIEKALNSIDTDYLKVAVTDGTNVLGLVSEDDNISATPEGPLVYGRRRAGTKATPIPVSGFTDPKANKGEFIVPATLMTGGREEGTFTRGFIPETEVTARRELLSVASASWTNLITYTVPAGNTFWLTDFVISNIEFAAGIEFVGTVDDGTTNMWSEKVAAGNSLKVHFNTPKPFSAGGSVRTYIRHWFGTNKVFSSFIRGFLTVDSELD